MDKKVTDAFFMNNNNYYNDNIFFEREFENSGLMELSVRYKGCNLDEETCPLCFAGNYAWLEDSRKEKEVDINENLDKKLKELDIGKKIDWIRILGGEPCISIKRIENTVEIIENVIDTIYDRKLNAREYMRAIIQTNGIGFSNSNEIQEIKSIIEKGLNNMKSKSSKKAKIVFEVSLKLPYVESIPDKKIKEKIAAQYRGYDNLLNKIIKPLWEKGYSDNIAIYPVAGFGPVLSKSINIVPIDKFYLETKGQETPIFSLDTWDEFLSIYEDFIENIIKEDAYKDYIDSFKDEKDKKGKKGNYKGTSGDEHKRVPLHALAPNRFQKEWIKRYSKDRVVSTVNEKKREYVPIEKILRRFDDIGRWNKPFKDREEVWHSIPKTINEFDIRESIEKMEVLFYQVKPEEHYPYL